MKLQVSEAKKIITDIAFDELRINNRECEALRCGVQALSIVEKIKEIIREVEHYEVSTNRPNQADYDAVSADKFQRIWKVISEARIESDDYCEWFNYDYRTIAPRNHDVKNPYWRIPNNMDKLKYCPYCGKEIKVVDKNSSIAECKK